MKVLLIRPLAGLNKIGKSKSSNFPIGIGYLASYLIENGHQVEILDNDAELLNKYELAEYINKSDHDLYGISGMAPQYTYVKALARLIKESKRKPVIIGGPLATYSYETVLENSPADVCVIGEGEETFIDLIDNLSDFHDVNGIAYKKEGKIIKTSPRVFQKSRDEYPFPAYDLFEMDRYFGKNLYSYEWDSKYLRRGIAETASKHQGCRTMNLITGLGCPYKCNFCSRSINKTRYRSIDHIIAEIEFLRKTYSVEGFRFIDELLILNHKRINELCLKIKPLGVMWSGQARSNTISEELAKDMKDAGCVGVGLGIESGSNHLLKSMNKKVTVEDHKKAITCAEKSNLAIKIQLLFGYPGENKDTVEETIAFFKKMEIPPRRFNILVPLPGSSIYEQALNTRMIQDEDQYLDKVSENDLGFGNKKILINLTNMTDKEFEDLLSYAEKTMNENYKRIIQQSYGSLWGIHLIQHFVGKQINRIPKIFELDRWQTKIGDLFNKSKVVDLTKKQLHHLYFNLDELDAPGEFN